MAESSNICLLKTDDKGTRFLRKRFRPIDAQDFSYGRKTNYWTKPSRIKLAITDNLPDKNLREGALLPCETEEKKLLKPDLSACFRSLFSL